ncbi:hypothetical protein ABG067_007717, partial [Albugo candida]
SGSEASDSEVKRRTKKVTYFGKEGGEGAEEGRKIWNPLTKLVISNFDVTLFLKRFRNKSIKVAEVKNSLKDFCVTKYLDNDDDKKDLLSFASSDSNSEASDSDVKRKKKLSYFGDEGDGFEKGRKEWNPVTKLVIKSFDVTLFLEKFRNKNIRGEDYELNIESPLDSIVQKISLSYKNKNFIFQSNSEAIFMEKYINPIIRIAFLDSCEKKFSNVNVTPATTSKYQAESDFVKIMKQMKRSINKQIDQMIKNPVSFALLVQGFKCRLFKMTLVEDGIYLPVLVKKFKLVEGIEDMVNVPAIAESLYFVKVRK